MSGVLCSNGCLWRFSTQKRPSRRSQPSFRRRSTRRRCLVTSRGSPIHTQRPRPLAKQGSPIHTQRPRPLAKQSEQHRTRVQSVLGFISTATPSRDFFDAAINSLVSGSAMICFALAFIPLLTYEEESEEQIESDELEAVKWTVASVVSCFPYLNWTSWLLLAFDSDPPLPYYFLSALYLTPFLKSGFDLNPFSVFMLVLGVMHMQVERVAQTEPAILGPMLAERPRLSSVLGQASESITRQLHSVFSDRSAHFERKRGKRGSIAEMVDRKLNEQEKELHDAEELARIEQQLWDKKFNSEDNRK